MTDERDRGGPDAPIRGERDRGGPDAPIRGQVSDRIELQAWAAPPPPAGLADRVLDRIDRVTGGGEPAVATAREPDPARAGWSRYLAVAAGGAALAAAATWWLTARPPSGQPAPAGHTVIAGAAPIALGDGVSAIATPGALLRWQRIAGDDAEPRPQLAITQTSGAVEYTSRGGARLSLTTPLAVIDTGDGPVRLTITPLPEETAVDKKSAAIGGVALLAAGIAVAVYEGKAHVRPAAGPARTLDAGQQLALAPSQAPEPPRPTLVAHATRDRGLRDQVATAIAAAQARRAARAGSAAPPGDAGTAAIGPDTPDGAVLPLKKEEIRDGVRETIPMLADCYQQELLDQGVIADGKLVAHLVVETEPDLGTVVTVDDQQPTELDFHTAQHGDAGATEQTAAMKDAMKTFGECVEVTLESVVLPPMRSDGRLSITYPFVFASDDGSGDGSQAAAGSGSGSDRTPPRRPPPTTTPRTTTPPTTAPRTAGELVGDAQEAAIGAQWARAVTLSEQALATATDKRDRDKALTIAALGACYTHMLAKARRYYPMLAPSRQVLVRQACLKQGLQVDR